MEVHHTAFLMSSVTFNEVNFALIMFPLGSVLREMMKYSPVCGEQREQEIPKQKINYVPLLFCVHVLIC